MSGPTILTATAILFAAACLYQQRTVEKDRDHHRAEATRLAAENRLLRRDLANHLGHPSTLATVHRIDVARARLGSAFAIDRMHADTATDFNARFVLDEDAETVGGV